MIRINAVLFLFLVCQMTLSAQFPAAAGQAGTTAIPASDIRFVNWAKTCEVERGFLNIAEPDLGVAGAGFPEEGIGLADQITTSLGDGGVAVLTFDPPIRDGIGWDFAVFENGFSQGENADFLELAFVEVSSDGENYARFPSTSLVQDTVESGGFATINAQLINNLAGKYVGGFGTPFDLSELADHPAIDVQNIGFVRIVDVIGTINEAYATYDSEGNKINDPYPTTFPSGGFDLDAVGVIKELGATPIIDMYLEKKVSISPNPIEVGAKLSILFKEEKPSKILLIDSQGRKRGTLQEEELFLPNLEKGVYFLNFYFEKEILVEKIVVY